MSVGLVVTAAVSLVVAVFFSAVEAGLSREVLTRPGDDDAEADSPLASPGVEPDDALNVLRLINVVLVVVHVAAVVSLLVATDWSGWLVGLCVTMDALLLYFLVEALARTLGITQSGRVVSVGWPAAAALTRLTPIRWLARRAISAANAAVPGAGLRQGPFASAEEFMALADAAVTDEVLEPDERDLIESVLEFGDTITREVMVPRTDMTVVDITMTVDDALEVGSKAGFSRLPLVGDSVDDVRGLVYVKDLIAADLADKGDDPVETWTRAARFLPESKKVNELLREMQRDSYHMAIVVDEYGGVAGVVTLEDLIEELVGEIVDEYDKEEPLVERQVDGGLRVDARILIDELNDLAGLELPEGDWDTVGGLVFDRFGRVPTEGDVIEVGDYDLRVERIQGRRITRVHIARINTLTNSVGEKEST